MTEKGLPFKLKGYSISYNRPPSTGAHPAVHFLWKRSVNDTLGCPEQVKRIHELKNESRAYYSRTILKLAIVKPCQANFLIKDFLGDHQLHLMIVKVICFRD